MATIPTQTKKRGHRRFARNYDRLVAAFEEQIGPKYRGVLLADLQGAVLEIGVGTGANFPYYRPANITRLVGIEPDFYMREQAEAKKTALGLDIELLEASAEQLPFPDNDFDAIVTTLVLCTVPNPALALTEMRRVLKPGGKLYFLEHVGSHNLVGCTFQTILNPLWGLMAGGCSLTRNTPRLIEQNGFQFERIEWLKVVPLNPINPQIWGVAF